MRLCAEAREWLLHNSDYKIIIDLNGPYACIEVVGRYKEAIIAYRWGVDLEKNVTKILHKLQHHAQKKNNE